MPPHRYINKDVLFDDDEEEWRTKRRTKYDVYGRPISMRDQQLERNRESERNKQLEVRKEELLNSTLQSTRNALIMLKESEDVGIASSIELHRQHDALKSTNSKLDQINADLKVSHRRISGMESCFIGIKKCFSRKHRKSKKEKKDKRKRASEVNQSNFEGPKSVFKTGTSFDDHPCTRLNGLKESNSYNETNTLIEEHLEEMAISVSRLKDIGLNMGKEIEQQITLLDVIESKVDKANITITSHTKRVNNLI